MKQNIFTLFVFAMALMVTHTTDAQKFSELDVSPMDAAAYPSNYRDSNKLIKIT